MRLSFMINIYSFPYLNFIAHYFLEHLTCMMQKVKPRNFHKMFQRRQLNVNTLQSSAIYLATSSSVISLLTELLEFGKERLSIPWSISFSSQASPA
ncbi:hypothetical protein IC582_012673 [Cucumis melo]